MCQPRIGVSESVHHHPRVSQAGACANTVPFTAPDHPRLEQTRQALFQSNKDLSPPPRLNPAARNAVLYWSRSRNHEMNAAAALLQQELVAPDVSRTNPLPSGNENVLESEDSGVCNLFCGNIIKSRPRKSSRA